MNIEEFQAIVKKYKKQDALLGILFCVLLIGIVFMGIFIGLLIEKITGSQNDLEKIATISFFCAFIIGIGVTYKLNKKFGYRCPYCSEQLAKYRTKLVILTGNCPSCGKKVIGKEDVTTVSQGTSIKISDFRKIDKTYQKKALWLIVFFYALVIICTGIVMMSWYLFRNKFDHDNLYLPEIHPLGLVGFLAGIFTIILMRILHKTELNFRQRHGCLCPNCGKQIINSAPIVIATGNCPHCGNKIIDKD